MPIARTTEKKTVKKKINPRYVGKITSPKEIDKMIEQMVKMFDQMQIKDQVKALDALGVGSKFFTCQHCSTVKPREKFYSLPIAGNASQITTACKQCAEDVAIPTIDGVKQQPTKQTVDDALYMLNKPMLDSLWESSLLEAANTSTGKTKNNVYTSYMKNCALPQYLTLSYRDSDNYNGGAISLEDMAENALPKDQEIIEQFEKNKSDTLRLLGYLPFDKEKLADQPFLYSQLIGFIDSSEEGNDDMMRTASIISIVRAFLQANKVDDMIAQLSADYRNAEKNIATIKALQAMKASTLNTANNLAKESCISLKNNKNSIKGENTWTGKVKKIKDLNLRGCEVNGFDIDTCRGMQQVQEISDASIMKQLALDESEWSDMVAEMRVVNQKLRNEKDQYKEINRILLRENLDLKDYIEDQGLDISGDCQDLEELYSIIYDMEKTDDEEEVEIDEEDSTSQ